MLSTDIITYTNPVYPHEFADPFVLRVGRTYYAYGTAPADPATGRHFPVLRSDNLAQWTYVGHALQPLTSPRGVNYWAREVAARNRNYQGRTWRAWHCVEGPFTLYHEGKYYCLYSGGAWYTANYGVGFATATDPAGPWRDDFAQHGPYVLKGLPEKVIGPGHNSVVLGPDDK